MKTPLRILPRLAALVFGFYGCVMAVLGGGFLWSRTRLLFHDSFYVVWDYLFDGLFLLVLGLAVLLPAGYVFLRRQARAAWLLVSLAILLFSAILIPSMRLDPAEATQFEVKAKVWNVRQVVREWGEENGRLPANEAEMLPVAQDHEKYAGRGFGDPLLSRYAQGGERLPYELVYIANATGAHLPEPPASQPGVIYCAVSADLRHLWLTATVLEHDVNGPVVFVKDEWGQPMVAEVSLEATPPTG